eukprot:SAG11_NODE_7048_length_1203_cov_1.078804_2_plen_131_part_00
MFARTGYNCSQVAGGEVDYLHCNQLVRDITAEEAYAMWTAGTIDLIIDVRSPTEYASSPPSPPRRVCLLPDAPSTTAAAAPAALRRAAPQIWCRSTRGTSPSFSVRLPQTPPREHGHGASEGWIGVKSTL